MADIPNLPASGGIDPGRPALPEIQGGAASRGLEEVGTQVSDLANHVLGMQRITQSNLATVDATNARDDIIHSVMQDPKFNTDPNAASAEVQKRFTGNTLPELKTKYPLAWRDAELNKNLTVLGDRGARIAYNNALTRGEQSAKDGLEASAQQAILSASDPNTTDTQLGELLHGDGNNGRIMGLVPTIEKQQAMGLLNPGEAEQMKTKLYAQVGQARFDRDAGIDPRGILAMTEPPNGIPMDHFIQTQARARDMIDGPMRAIESDREAERAQALNASDAYVKANGAPDFASLNSLAANKIITDDDYRHITGRDYMMKTDPVILSSYDDRIANATGDEDLDLLNANVESDARSKVVGGADVPFIHNAINERKKFFKTEAGQETRTGLDMIRRAYQNFGTDGFVYDKLAKVQGFPSITETEGNATKDFYAATAGVTDRSKINAAWHKAIDDNQPSWEKAGLKARPVVLPTGSDDDILKAYRAIKAGLPTDLSGKTSVVGGKESPVMEPPPPTGKEPALTAPGGAS